MADEVPSLEDVRLWFRRSMWKEVRNGYEDIIKSLRTELADALERDRMGDEIIVDLTLKSDRLALKLEGYQTLLAKIGKKMNDPLLSQRERIMIAEDIRRHLEAPK